MQSPPCSTSSSLTRRSHPTATTLKNQQANKPTSREAGKPESWRVHHQYRAGCRPPVMVIAQCSHCILPSLHNAITPPPPRTPALHRLRLPLEQAPKPLCFWLRISPMRSRGRMRKKEGSPEDYSSGLPSWSLHSSPLLRGAHQPSKAILAHPR